MIFVNGNIFTADDSIPFASAIAVKSHNIIAVGETDLILNYKTDQTTVIDLGGKFAMPGLHEGHAHFLSLGKSLNNLQLQNARNWDEIVLLASHFAEKIDSGAWIEGRGWHQDKWDKPVHPSVNSYPYHDQLSSFTSKNPVVLIHASGHGLIANQMAMDIAGISKESVAPAGGRIVKDDRGQITGVFEENAMELITRPLREFQKKTYQEKIKVYAQSATEEALKYGITSFQDAGVTLEELNALYLIFQEGKQKIKLSFMHFDNYPEIMRTIDQIPFHSSNEDMFSCKSIKLYIDGALGSYGAWLLSPYADNPQSTGQNTMTISSIDSVAKICFDRKLQLCTHAIGDRANREVLNIFRSYPNPNLRWRIEHAQHIDPSDIPRFAEQNIIASIQAIHCTSDAPFVSKRLGIQRAKETSYKWRSLLDHHARLANGTDAPVESINPFECIYASVTRRRLDNDLVFFPEESMTRVEALKSYTIWNSYASFHEKRTGSLIPGKSADIIVLDRDLLHCKEADIPGTQVLSVYLNGIKIR